MQTENGGDAIHIEQLEVFARIGVPDDERSHPQRLTVSMTFWPTGQGRELGDDLGRTVDYAAVCAETKKFVQARSDRLIETLADALANHLLGMFEIRRITIELRKFILPEVEFVSVTVTRDRVNEVTAIAGEWRACESKLGRFPEARSLRWEREPPLACQKQFAFRVAPHNLPA